MIWLWRIFFSSLLLSATALASSVTGRVQLKDSGDVQVRKKMDYSGVVVYLKPAAAPAPASPKHARMIQKNKTFIPHVLPVQVGTMVDFPNFDPIFHNAFSNYNGQLFDLSLYPPGSTRSVRFKRPGVVRVFCNIHATMSAVILVLDTPYFATTDRAGVFDLQGVPPGDYDLGVFHERATEQTLTALGRRVVVPSFPLPAVNMEISESGFLPIPHKNKYGQSYPPQPDERTVYPVVRN
ncbi:MAG: hypothetical protein M3Z36_01085 [Acidobacteriota bacterium]|nr:hypothetical protein [Acidobacteriota bacterium]